jgi:hypothetical protein
MVAKTVASRKAKGRKHQQEIVKAILELFPELEPDDVKSTGMGQSGEDIQLSPKARKLLPVAIEAKCQETLNFWAAYEQAKVNSKNKYIPVVVAKRNRTEPIAVLSFTSFLWLIRQLKGA